MFDAEEIVEMAASLRSTWSRDQRAMLAALLLGDLITDESGTCIGALVEKSAVGPIYACAASGDDAANLKSLFDAATIGGNVRYVGGGGNGSGADVIGPLLADRIKRAQLRLARGPG